MKQHEGAFILERFLPVIRQKKKNEEKNDNHFRIVYSFSTAGANSTNKKPWRRSVWLFAGAGGVQTSSGFLTSIFLTDSQKAEQTVSVP